MTQKTGKDAAKEYADRVRKFGLPFIVVRANNTRDYEKEAELKKSLGYDS
jgi:hypothetical protein